ncbi:MAG TPA: type VI secretion system baseplate subunit TssK, partial [Longimicrobium sp.]|nr:type VI secretion system baseplate subunit TssK [Longimicrobium sp.]
MESTVRLPDAVLWHEGMLLAPQHFQQAALRGEELLHYRVSAAQPYSWGVRHLAVEPRLLAEGTFRVTGLEAILPDGVVAWVREDRDHPLEVDLKPHAEAARRGYVTVHLGVPLPRRESEPVAGQLPRFDRVEGSGVADENTGEGDVPVPRLRPHCTLMVSPTAPDKYSSIPLARLTFRDGAFTPAPYVPPVPTIAPGSPLATDAASVARRLREKALFFSDRARAAETRPADSTTTDLHRWVRALVLGLPRLDALVSLGTAHPLDLHLALCDVAGLLAGLHTRVPPIFPRYDHTDLRATFDPVLTWCGDALAELQESFLTTRFAYHEGVYETTLQAFPAAGAPLLVGVRPGTLTEGEVVAWMEECRMGSASRMASLAGRRVRGAARRRVAPAGELALAAGSGVILFEVTPDGENVIPGESLQLVHPEPGRRADPAEVVLYTR